MKKLVIVAALALACCGGGGESSDEDTSSVNPGSGTNFGGNYVLRDHNCNLAVELLGFRITQTGTDLRGVVTKTTPGSSLTIGDAFHGFVGFIDEIQQSSADFFDEILCIGVLILTEADADSVANNRIIDAQVGDMLAECADTSADSLCALTYQRLP